MSQRSTPVAPFQLAEILTLPRASRSAATAGGRGGLPAHSARIVR
jgi:hypothetical protein